MVHDGYSLTKGSFFRIPHDYSSSNIINFHRSALSQEFLAITFGDRVNSFFSGSPPSTYAYFRKLSSIRDDIPIEISVRFNYEDEQNVLVELSIFPAIDLKLRQHVKEYAQFDSDNLFFFSEPSVNEAKNIGAILKGIEIQAPSIAKEILPNETTSIPNRKIFVVHGRDNLIKNEVEDFLKSLNLEPIILHKQADLGKTIIEKVEFYSDVGFAIILLTADDFGGLPPSKNYEMLRSYAKTPGQFQYLSKDNTLKITAEFIEFIKEIVNQLNPRARQNVIFEFGYFIGKLGRGKVAALCEEKIERPSDIDGLLYTPLDELGEWKKKLAREINATGIEIDAKFL